MISVLEERVGMKPEGSTYDKKAARNGVGKPMMCVCFYCAGELVHGDPGHYVLPGFLPLDTRKAIKKFNTAMLTNSWRKVTRDSFRGRDAKRMGRHAEVIFERAGLLGNGAH